LRDDAKTAPISTEERAHIDAILGLRETMPNVLSNLRDIAMDLPGIADAVDLMAARMDAFSGAGIDVAHLPFEGSYGRTTLEYYDGFVFGFYPVDGGVPVATGGRYDALTQHLGNGESAPAVGGVIRPDLLLALGGHA
jgi:ATP phosphoribosyltransferase regulatory subunit